MLRLKAFKARFSVQPEVILNYRAGRFEIDNRGATQTNQEILQQLLIENPGVQAKRFEDMGTGKGVARNKARDFLATGIVTGAIRVDRGQHNSRFHTWVGATWSACAEGKIQFADGHQKHASLPVRRQTEIERQTDPEIGP